MPRPVIQSGPHPEGDSLDLVTITGLARAPGWRFDVTVQPPSGREPAHVVGVEVNPGTDKIGRRLPLTAPTFRRIPIGEVIRLAESLYNRPVIGLVAEHLGAVTGPRPYGGSPEHHRAVATLYRTALAQGLNPREALADVYQVTPKTISRWLAEARQPDAETGRPHLGPYRQEQAEYGTTADERRFLRQTDNRQHQRTQR